MRVLADIITVLLLVALVFAVVKAFDSAIYANGYSNKLDQCVLDNKDQLNAKDWCAAKIRLNK